MKGGNSENRWLWESGTPKYCQSPEKDIEQNTSSHNEIKNIKGLKLEKPYISQLYKDFY